MAEVAQQKATEIRPFRVDVPEAERNKLSYFGVKGVSIPVGVSSFPDEIDLCPRSWAERAYPKLIH
jgi:hypothetical protein